MPHICRELFREVSILANGNVVCSSADASGWNILGNIYQSRIYDIFNGTKYKDLRQKILESGSDEYCPANKFKCYYKTQTFQDFGEDLKIEILQLETTSYCNLKCPSCPVPLWVKFGNMISYHPRLGQLSTEKIEEVLTDIKDTLKQILLYNYGEPFLDKRLLEILRFAKKLIPNVYITTSTNGTTIPRNWIKTIIEEGLIDYIVFSIDGASQETYSKYRIGGNFDKAFKDMVEFIEFRKAYKKSIPVVKWQYILFEWNDSDRELKLAQELAAKNGLDIVWVLTSSEGKSQRYKLGSERYQKLQGLKTPSAGIVVPGHGCYLKSPKMESTTGESRPEIKTIWMTFFRLGGGLGDDVANGLFLAAAILFTSIFLLPISLFMKFIFFISCILTVRLYRQKEKNKLKNEFREILSKNPKDFSEYIQEFINIYYNNLEVYNVSELPHPLGLTGDNLLSFQSQCLGLACVRCRFSGDAGEKLDTLSPVNDLVINSISNGKFKKLLCYEPKLPMI